MESIALNLLYQREKKLNLPPLREKENGSQSRKAAKKKTLPIAGRVPSPLTRFVQMNPAHPSA